ncbi:MAG: SpoIID/LytB domain-containing protein [Candidatus Obscuribacterales bacterium]|nr:SpoIID/LytB domain-containing protein [Candidatus Obscuribacterales bacterium]
MFESRQALDSLQILGNSKIVSPLRMHLAGSTQIKVNRDRVEVIPLDLKGRIPNLKHPLVSAPYIIIEPASGPGIRVRTSAEVERVYGGRLHFSVDSSALLVHNEISTSEYVSSVVGSEAPPSCPLEALKAFAVMTIAIVERKKDGELIGDSTREQAYLGKQYATAPVRTAVRTVMNKRWLYGKNSVRPYYHSTCSGGTSSGAAIFGPGAAALKYLRGVKCVYCAGSPFWKDKTSTVSLDSFRALFSDTVPAISGFDEAGRPLQLVGSKSDGSVLRLTGYEAWLKIGRQYGWGLVPGTRYSYSVNGDSVTLKSSGAGHGVGLCQWGAAGLANEGKSFDQILSFYFPGTRIVEKR